MARVCMSLVPASVAYSDPSTLASYYYVRSPESFYCHPLRCMQVSKCCYGLFALYPAKITRQRDHKRDKSLGINRGQRLRLCGRKRGDISQRLVLSEVEALNVRSLTAPVMN